MPPNALGDVFETLRVDMEHDGIAVVTINRPDRLNALNRAVVDELERCVEAVRLAEDVRAVVVTGAGPKSFVAGADIAEFRGLDRDAGQRLAERGQAVFLALERLRKPVLAAVNGYALGGGCELALACHVRIASETAVFGQPEVNLGLIPGYGGTQRLPRIVGRGVATEMILTGNSIDARRASEVGLVSRVVEPEALMEATLAVARTILERSPLAVARALDAIEMSERPLEEGLLREAELFGAACDSEDFSEGVAAFLERRKPAFTGR